jgi:hypothetical protein
MSRLTHRPSGITLTGRAARYVFWRAPAGISRKFLATQWALLSFEGQRWAALFGFGIYTLLIIFITFKLSVGESIGAFFGLVWIWFFIFLIRGAHKRRNRARNQIRYEKLLLQGQVQLVTAVKQLTNNLTGPEGGGFTMLGSARRFRTRDNEQIEMLKQTTFTEDELQQVLGDQFGMPTGQNAGKIPRWVKRMWK